MSFPPGHVVPASQRWWPCVKLDLTAYQWGQGCRWACRGGWSVMTQLPWSTVRATAPQLIHNSPEDCASLHAKSTAAYIFYRTAPHYTLHTIPTHYTLHTIHYTGRSTEITIWTVVAVGTILYQFVLNHQYFDVPPTVWYQHYYPTGLYQQFHTNQNLMLFNKVSYVY